MRLYAAVPVKDLHESKSRLEHTVSDRAALTLHMLERVLDSLAACSRIDRIAVVSRDAAVLHFATSHAADPLLQGSTGLNPACAEAAEWAMETGADALLVAHGDLPHLASEEVARMIRLAEGEERFVAVLAPDRCGMGTNLMLLRPPHAMPHAFGADSFKRHCREAERLGLRLHVFRSPGTMHDVDTAEDLHLCSDVLDEVAGSHTL